MNTQLVSKNLQILRKKHNLTQEDLAQELSISRQAVSKWETGNTVPDLEIILKLSKLYQISVNDIVEPKTPPYIIKDFEQITELSEIAVKNVLNNFTVNDIVKASMGASPTVNKLLKKIFPDIDFDKKQTEIGRIKIEEIEDVQNQITVMINLENAN